jgi:hypothetical protein
MKKPYEACVMRNHIVGSFLFFHRFDDCLDLLLCLYSYLINDPSINHAFSDLVDSRHLHRYQGILIIKILCEEYITVAASADAEQNLVADLQNLAFFAEHLGHRLVCGPSLRDGARSGTVA